MSQIGPAGSDFPACLPAAMQSLRVCPATQIQQVPSAYLVPPLTRIQPAQKVLRVLTLSQILPVLLAHPEFERLARPAPPVSV